MLHTNLTGSVGTSNTSSSLSSVSLLQNNAQPQPHPKVGGAGKSGDDALPGVCCTTVQSPESCVGDNSSLEGNLTTGECGRGTCRFLKEDEVKAEELKTSVSKVL